MNGSVLTLGDGLHELRKRLIGRSPIQCLPGPVVQQIGDGVQRILLMDTQIGRSSPLVFSQLARCQGLCGSQKYTRMFVALY